MKKIIDCIQNLLNDVAFSDAIMQSEQGIIPKAYLRLFEKILRCDTEVNLIVNISEAKFVIERNRLFVEFVTIGDEKIPKLLIKEVK